MRTKIVAGNWKMNLTFDEADDLVNQLLDFVGDKAPDASIILCPPACYLELVSDYANDFDIYTGAQNISEHESGAYTGEISATMLESMEIDYTIIGHSERRKHFNESNQLLAAKVNMALKHKVNPIFCCGELLSERQQGRHYDVVKNQLQESLFHLNKTDFGNVIMAYEPVWAIGTGENATPEQAQEMHAYIRGLVREKYGAEVADNTSILYGGSCNAKNAKDLFANEDVDGGLIGGASLKADDFIKIIQSI